LPQNGGAEILEGKVEMKKHDGTFAEETTACQLAEDSTVFDSRTCTIPLSLLR
jgi:hypothetical protein